MATSLGGQVSGTADARNLRRKAQSARALERAAIHLVLPIGAVAMLFPLYWMISTSLKPEYEVFLLPPTWIPSEFQWIHYYQAFVDYFNFAQYGSNTVEGALTPEEVDQFSWRFDAIIERGETQGDGSEAGDRIFPDGHRVILPLIEADPYFYNILDHPNLAAIPEDLLGEDCIFYGSSDGQIHDGDTTWHRDGGSPGPAIEAKLTFYLDDVAPGKGCLSFIPGSHLWPLHYNDLEKKIEERVLGYPMQEFPGRYDLPAGKGDVIVFHTRIWHSSWGGGANRRQMAWMMRTAPRMQWEIDRIAGFLDGYAQKWSKKSGRLISDRLFETADEQRMKKIQLLKDLGA